jgi:hypothetical protein
VRKSKEDGMTQSNRFYLAALLAGLLYLGQMSGGTTSAADKNPCSEDVEKFCKNIKPGGGAIMDCLEEHESELSDACKDYEAKMGGRRIEIREEMRERIKLHQACKDDVAKFCRDVKPGPGVVAKCLEEHKNELSTPCRERIKAVKVQIEKEKKKTE